MAHSFSHLQMLPIGHSMDLGTFPHVQYNLPLQNRTSQIWKRIWSHTVGNSKPEVSEPRLERWTRTLSDHSSVSLWIPCLWWKTTKEQLKEGQNQVSQRAGAPLLSGTKSVLYLIFFNARNYVQKWNKCPNQYLWKLGSGFFSLSNLISLYYYLWRFLWVLITPSLTCTRSYLTPICWICFMFSALWSSLVGAHGYIWVSVP